MRKCICLIFAFVTFLVCSAQHDVLPFRSLTTDMGLSNGDIFCFFQDHEGYLWIGTSDGLNKYDGVQFTVYKYDRDDKTTLSSSYVSAIYEDRNHNLWIGMSNGLCRYNRDFNNFERIDYSHDYGTKFKNHVQEIFEDSYHNLWIGTDYGIFILDREKKKFLSCFDDKCNKDDTAICNEIVEDKSGNIWFALYGGGLIKYNPGSHEFKRYTAKSNDFATKENDLLSLMVDEKNNLWIGYSTKGIQVINPQFKTVLSYEHNPGDPYSLGYNIIFSMVKTDDNKVLISTDGGGIDILNLASGKFSHNTTSESDFSLLSNTVQKVYIDRNGVIWAGCWGGGINYYDKRFDRFALYKEGRQYFNSLSGSSVTSITQDQNGNIWLGTDGGGINLFNTQTRSFKHFKSDGDNKNSLTNNKVLALQADKNGGLWAGMWLGGLNYFRIEGNSLRLIKKYDYLDKSDPSSNSVFRLYLTKSGDLWVGNYYSGLFKFNPATQAFIPVKLSVALARNNITIRDIYCDSRNDMWFATEYNGLFRLKQETGEIESFLHDDLDSNSLYNNSVNVIYEDSKNRIWIGVDDGGLNLFDPASKTFSHYTVKEGLPDNFIVGILEDDNGSLWLSSHVGISRATFLSDDKKPLLRFRNYDVPDGLQGKVFNRWSYFRSSTGEMYFGGLNGFNMFHPDSLRDYMVIPQVHFTDFLLFNKSVVIGSKNSPLKKHISQTKKIVLKAKQSVFTFRFIALNFVFSKKNQYAYKMTGFDKDWNYVGNKTEATYTNLNPGSYTFTVKASNNDGIWNEKGASVDLVILPPWYKTWLFRIVLLVFVVSLLLGFYVNRTHRFRDNQIMLESMVQERTKELKATNRALEEKQREINKQKEELQIQKNSVQEANDILLEQQKRIVEQNKELDKHRYELEKLVSERTRQLEEAKKRAEEADSLKSAFLANMSHEIRTPMNAIVGFAGLLNEPDITNEEKADFVKHIHSNSESLLMLINDILDLSMIEANQVTIRKEPFLLNELLDHIYSVHALNNKNPELEIILNNALKEENLKLNTDKFRLKQILTNFMSNACKFTEKGSVELGITKSKEKLNMYVKDTGIGIAEKDQEHLFKRFRKIGEYASTKVRGTGLGLAISKRLAELLGGTIEVKSEVGKGSFFTFSIPFSAIITDTIISHPAEPQFYTRKDWTGKHILVAEDEEANYLYLKRVLEKTNIIVTWAQNGQEAVDLVAAGKDYDIILMDIKMPTLNGIEALKLLKRIKPDQRIIAQTAYARTEDEIMLRKEGFDDYISKPISPIDLMILLEKFLYLPHD
jgi:signal transduction histidine kinase/ligand-binding sensor domain-containing protein/CheY-like chemotaxis protein